MGKITDKPTRKKKEEPKKTRYDSPDGMARPLAVERKLNRDIALLFNSALGKKVNDYLISITTNRVMPQGSSPEAIVYQEGARWVMGVIATRAKLGREKKP